MKINIPLTRPYFDSEELTEIKKVLNSGWVSQGPKTKEFEELASKYLGVKHAIPVSNCTAALHLALLALEIKRGDEVIVADYTYPATGHSVVYCGATPRFVDIDPQTYNINPELLQSKLTSHTKAIIPVHTFGQPADMDPIMEFACDHNLRVIEDAACAFGAKYKKKFAGTISDIGCYSFHARKGLTTGEGGMVVTNNNKLAKKIRHLSVFGMKTAWERQKRKKFSPPIFTDIGYNYKMSDITAAVGKIQLSRLDKTIKKKIKLAKYWDEKLENIDHISPPYSSKNSLHVYQSYVALVEKNINRNKLIGKLLKKGVQSQIGTYASHIQPVYKSKDNCPISIETFNRALALPMYYTLKESEIDFVTCALKNALEE